MVSGFEGLDLNMFQLFMLLYADDIVIFARTAEELQHGYSSPEPKAQR